MSKILYDRDWEREGNDSWLCDNIQIVERWGITTLTHTWRHNGWAGLIEGSEMITLNENAQPQIDEYLKQENLDDYYKIALNELCPAL